MGESTLDVEGSDNHLVGVHVQRGVLEEDSLVGGPAGRGSPHAGGHVGENFSNPPAASIVVAVDPSLGFATLMCTSITTVVTRFGHKTTIHSSRRRACKFCRTERWPVQSCEPTWRLGRRFGCCRRWYCGGKLRGRGSSREALYGRCVGNRKLETAHACRCGVA